MKIEEIHKEICGSIATCEENKRKFTLKNATDFVKVKIDGEVIPKGKEPRCCDYYFYKEKEVEIFVELKGTDVKDALKQLDKSISLFLQNFGKKYAFSVVKNAYPNENTTIQRFKAKMKKKGIEFNQKTNVLECSYMEAQQRIKIHN